MSGIEDRLARAFGEDPLEGSLEDWLGAEVPMAPARPVFGPDGDHERTEGAAVLPAPDEDTADRLLGRRLRVLAERERINDLADRRIGAINEWREDTLAGTEAELERIEQSVELFMREWHRANPKRKSLPLPNGIPRMRAPSAGRVEFTDERAFVAWAEKHGREHLLRYKPEGAASALREEPHRRVRPDETLTDPRTGDTALYHTWGILVDIADETTGEVVQAEAPGVRYVQRVADKFSIGDPKESDEQEEQT